MALQTVLWTFKLYKAPSIPFFKHYADINFLVWYFLFNFHIHNNMLRALMNMKAMGEGHWWPRGSGIICNTPTLVTGWHKKQVKCANFCTRSNHHWSWSFLQYLWKVPTFWGEKRIPTQLRKSRSFRKNSHGTQNSSIERKRIWIHISFRDEPSLA